MDGTSRYRESRVESAETAEDIFDLYGEPNGSVRESWQSGTQAVGLGIGTNGAKDTDARLSYAEGRTSLAPPLPSNGSKQAYRLSQIPARPEVEELEDEAHTPGTTHSWDGPMAALSKRASGISIASTSSGSAPDRRLRAVEQDTEGDGLSRRGSRSGTPSRPSTLSNGGNGSTSIPSSTRRPPPSVIVTPDMTPSRRTQNGSGDGEDSRRVSILSASTADSPSLNRLTPRMSGYGANGSMSQASFGSSQYPGEDADAFHVRSTYARLESEGVHGDGYLPGVERTRGGPNVGKRATTMEAQKGDTVGEKERGFLSSLDRYGFINQPLRNRSETRLALIPSAPFSKIPKLPSKSPLAGQPRVDPPPPGPGGGGDGPQARTPGPKSQAEEEGHKRKESERVGKWMKMMGVKRREGGNAVEWNWKDEGTSKLTRRVYKGVPDRWRMAAWWTLAEARANDAPRDKGKRKAEDLYIDYRNSIDLPSSFDVQIDLDVPRTISGHTLFVTRYGAGQRSLFHVLHCFAMLCDTCGYCQGMGPIAATLLCYFDPERVYALMVRLHDVYGMHEIFAPGFPGLLEAFYVQERLIEWLIPDVYKSFQKNMISSSSWGTKWYITLFVNTIPFSQQLRLWDAMFLDGRDVMIIASLSILWAFKDLLAAPTATFESILSLLSSYFVAEDEDKLMRWIKRMIHQPGIKQRMDGWRAEWQSLVREGKDRDALL